MKPVIGLVGGIGAGKSAVAHILAELGCLVVNSDDLARQALRVDSIKRALRSWWGDRVFDRSGEVDRSAVASIVFADPAERKRLESLTHPWIEARRKAMFADAPAGTRAMVIDAPLLLEAGIDRECDVLIFVDAPPAVRERRVRASRGWGVGELARREAAQMPLDEKRRRADHTIVNHGDLARLREEVRRLLDDITRSTPPAA